MITWVMFYFESRDFYRHISIFMSDDFFLLRKMYIYDILTHEEIDKFYSIVKDFVPNEFFLFIDKIKSIYKAENCEYYLKKYVNELSLKFEVPCCRVWLSSKITDEEKLGIEKKIKGKFEEDNIKFNYKIVKDLKYGIILSYKNKIYDLTLFGILNNLKENLIKKVIVK